MQALWFPALSHVLLLGCVKKQNAVGETRRDMKIPLSFLYKH